MHYVQYTPGFIARIITEPTRHGSTDVNRLSQLVVKFNGWLTLHYDHKPHIKLAKFVKLFKPVQL